MINVKFCLISSVALALPVMAAPERIEVTERAPSHQRFLAKVLPQQSVLDETSVSGDSLANLLEQAPTINLNGQGGLFQTVNIRGFARWRVKMLVAGIPIHTERRAGTASEFVPPSFVSQAYVTQGAASTQLGSGAIGGGVDLLLKWPQYHAVNASIDYLADKREFQLSGLSQQHDLGWMVNHRHGNNSQDAQGEPIQNRFEQHSLMLRKRFKSAAVREGMVLYSTANNIAKASADDPSEKFTLYPSNDHLLGQLKFDWLNATFYVHDSHVMTQVERPGKRLNKLSNKALDLGVNLSEEWRYQNWQINGRATVDGRTGVHAFEREYDATGNETFARFNLDAEQWEAAIATELSYQQVQSRWVGGVRLAQQYQHDNHSQHSSNDTNLSAFVGYAATPNPHWQWGAYLSHAYRVPSLTERYFAGSTPRGTVLGSTSLATEKALNLEANVSYQKAGASLSMSLFQQKITDYIERIRVSEDTRVYRNLSNATVSGLSYQAGYEFDAAQVFWRVTLSGQWLSGENDEQQRIADIAPAQHRLALSAFADKSHSFIVLKHRQASGESAPGELARNRVTTLDAGYQYQLSPSLEIGIQLSNLTDAHYATSRDDLAPFAPGRNAQISLEMVF